MFKNTCAKIRRPLRRARLYAGVLALLGLFVSTAVIYRTAEAQKPARSRTKRVSPATAQKKPQADYSRFFHHTHVVQTKLSCESCHKFPSKNWKDVHKGDEGFPDLTEYPEHKDCLACHRQQFFARERPVPRICSNCHVNATPADTSRYPFPSLGEKFTSSAKARDFISDFRVQFPHDKHLDVISTRLRPRSFELVTASFRPRLFLAEDSDPKSCAVCHRTYPPQGKSVDEFVTKPPKEIWDWLWI